MRIHAAVDNDIHPARFGGSQRSFGLARGLASRHDVRVLCLVPNRTSAPADERVDGVQLLRRKAWHTSVVWRLHRRNLAPMFAAEPGHRANARRYLAMLGDGADVLSVDLNLRGLLPLAGSALRVYTSHNVEAARLDAAEPELVARPWWVERVRRLERSAVEQADVVVVCSEEDAARMRQLHGARPEATVVIPNGYDETALRAPSAAERAQARGRYGFSDGDYVVAFTGSDWWPNREALARFLEGAAPALAGGGFKLLVVGSIGRSVPSQPGPGVVVAGEVESLLGALAAADAGLNPVLSGGGSNVKLPSYLAAGLAVITTPFGLRGYETLAPHVTVAEPQDLGKAIATRPAGWGGRGGSAPEALLDFAWGRLGERLGEAYEAHRARIARERAEGAA